MCGEIEEENRFQADLHQRFLVHARAMLAHRPAGPAGLNAYLDTLFAELLQRCVQDCSAAATDAAPDASDAYGRMAMQSLVLARLAGFLAGHVALNEDPMRKLVEAMMLGYSEADMHPTGHDHHHDDGHSHGHGHGHHH